MDRDVGGIFYLLHFLIDSDGWTGLPICTGSVSGEYFEAYNDEEQLRMLQEKIEQGRLYQKNFKEFGNSYRVDLFIQKAFSKNHPEAYTGKVFWSGITGYNGAFLSTGIFRVSPGTQFDFLVRSGVGL